MAVSDVESKGWGGEGSLDRWDVIIFVMRLMAHRIDGDFTNDELFTP